MDSVDSIHTAGRMSADGHRFGHLARTFVMEDQAGGRQLRNRRTNRSAD